MGAIPSSDLPGHKKLHDRVNNALDLCQESKSVDFKESATWGDLKWHIIRTSLAMGNLRDGGVIVIGASERDSHWNLSGIKEEHLSTFKFDDITESINRYSSPSLRIDIVTVKYRNNNIFLAIQIHEFEELPFVCKHNGPDNIKISLHAGDFYVRPSGKPQTKKVSSAEEMQDLLELSAERKARKILEIANRLGLKPEQTSLNKFDEELEGL